MLSENNSEKADKFAYPNVRWFLNSLLEELQKKIKQHKTDKTKTFNSYASIRSSTYLIKLQCKEQVMLLDSLMSLEQK